MRTPYNEDTLKTTWPYITQFAWMVVAVDETGLRTVLEEYSCYIRPNYPESLYSEEAKEVSGISYKTLTEHGKEIREVLASFLIWLQKVDFVVSHNTTFDMKVVKAEMLRHGFTEHLRTVPWLDTVYYGGEYIRSRYSLRRRQFPKLGTLYNHLTGKSAPQKLHDAMTDVRVCATCLNHLIKNNTLSLSRIQQRIDSHIPSDNSFA